MKLLFIGFGLLFLSYFEIESIILTLKVHNDFKDDLAIVNIMGVNVNQGHTGFGLSIPAGTTKEQEFDLDLNADNARNASGLYNPIELYWRVGLNRAKRSINIPDNIKELKQILDIKIYPEGVTEIWPKANFSFS